MQDFCFREVIEAYPARIRAVVEDLRGWLSLTTGIDGDKLSKLHGESAQGLQMNYCPCSEPHKVLGVSPHSDTDHTHHTNAGR